MYLNQIPARFLILSVVFTVPQERLSRIYPVQPREPLRARLPRLSQRGTCYPRTFNVAHLPALGVTNRISQTGRASIRGCPAGLSGTLQSIGDNQRARSICDEGGLRGLQKTELTTVEIRP
jgi:hypothetical protein